MFFLVDKNSWCFVSVACLKGRPLPPHYNWQLNSHAQVPRLVVIDWVNNDATCADYVGSSRPGAFQIANQK
jgi:hypothetical protein